MDIREILVNLWQGLSLVTVESLLGATFLWATVFLIVHGPKRGTYRAYLGLALGALAAAPIIDLVLGVLPNHGSAAATLPWWSLQLAVACWYSATVTYTIAAFDTLPAARYYLRPLLRMPGIKFLRARYRRYKQWRARLPGTRPVPQGKLFTLDAVRRLLKQTAVAMPVASVAVSLVGLAFPGLFFTDQLASGELRAWIRAGRGPFGVVAVCTFALLLLTDLVLVVAMLRAARLTGWARTQPGTDTPRRQPERQLRGWLLASVCLTLGIGVVTAVVGGGHRFGGMNGLLVHRDAADQAVVLVQFVVLAALIGFAWAILDTLRVSSAHGAMPSHSWFGVARFSGWAMTGRLVVLHGFIIYSHLLYFGPGTILAGRPPDAQRMAAIMGVGAGLLGGTILLIYERRAHGVFRGVQRLWLDLIVASARGWSSIDDRGRRVAIDNLFAKLVQQIDSEACYLELWLDDQQPLVLNYQWYGPPPSRAALDKPQALAYDLRAITIGAGSPPETGGLLALVRRGGRQYEETDLEIAAAVGQLIACLYLPQLRVQGVSLLALRRRMLLDQQHQALTALVAGDGVSMPRERIRRALGDLPYSDATRAVAAAARELDWKLRSFVEGQRRVLEGEGELITGSDVLSARGLWAALHALKEQYEADTTDEFSMLAVEVKPDNTVKGFERALDRALGEYRARLVLLTCERAVQHALSHGHVGRQGIACQIWVARDRGDLVVTVRDNGRGIARAYGDRNDRIGLGVEREAFVALGGSLALAPRPGGGTRLRLRLPLAEPHALRQAGGHSWTPAEWFGKVAEVESEHGERALVNDIFPDATWITEGTQLDRQLGQMYEHLSDPADAIRAHKRRIELLRTNLDEGKVRCRALLSRHHLETYLRFGKVGHGKPDRSREYVKRRAEEFLAFMEKYPHYEVRLTNQDEPDCNFEVIAGKAVLWERRDFDRVGIGGMGYIGECFRESAVVADYQEYFDRLWELAALCDNSAVRRWLRGILKDLARRSQAEPPQPPHADLPDVVSAGARQHV